MSSFTVRINLFWILLFLCSIPSAFAQLHGKLSGKVTAEDGSPILYASVAILNKDGKMLKGMLSDTLGNFTFTAIPHATYQIKITNMGFNEHIQDFILNKNTIDLGRITMVADARMLNAVTIKAEKRLIEQSIDKTVINVENSILSEGNSALELLERAPGVKIDQDGKISLKGRTGVNVMINGKLTYLSAKELSLLLKGTNAASISKIEIMGNPSAKYDAAGNAGIINILMKKNLATGFNGSVALNGGAGRKARYGSGINLNYRADKFNLYGSYDYGFRGETEYLDFIRRFSDNGMNNGQPARTSTQHTKTNEPLHTNNFRAGIDYDFNPGNTISFLINGNVGHYIHDSKTGNLLQNNANGNTISNMATTNYDKQNWKNLTYSLNYLHKFKKEGRELSADADFASNTFTSNLNLNTQTITPAEGQADADLSRRGYVPAKTDVYLAKLDYTDPLTKTLKLESGLKSSFTTSDNNLRYDLLNNGNWEYDANGSNHFRYKEQIHAGYLNFKKDFKSFSIQAGLRGEYTRTEGHQITTDSLITRNYFQLFHSIFVSKPLGENHQIQAAYSRRIERPNYGDLNPFRVFRDPMLFYQGNPFLKPEMINTFQISHTFKGNYTTSISYNHTNDVMTWVSGQIDSENTTFEMPQNLHKLINYGISFTASTSILEWWSGTHFANVFRNEYEGTADSKSFSNKTTSFSFNSQNSFKAGKGYTMELNANYNSGSVYGISSYKPNYTISAGIQKMILKDKGSLKLMVNDIFQTYQYKERTLFQNIDMNSHIRVDSRRAILSFSYRFGNQKLEGKKRKTGSEDIQGRIKGS